MLYYLAVTLYVFVCLLLLLVVLLQQGKGGDIASAFGGGSSQTTFGARQGATVLSRATTVLGALFIIGALGLAIYGTRGPSSVVGGMPGPAPAQRPAPTPAAPSGQPAPTGGGGTSQPAPSGGQPATPQGGTSQPAPPAPQGQR